MNSNYEKHLEDARLDRVDAMEREARELEEFYADLAYEQAFRKRDPKGYEKYLLEYAESARLESEARGLVGEVSVYEF